MGSESVSGNIIYSLVIGFGPIKVIRQTRRSGFELLALPITDILK